MSRRQRVPGAGADLINAHTMCANTHPGGARSTAEMPSRATVRPPCLNNQPIRKSAERAADKPSTLGTAQHKACHTRHAKFLTRALTD